MGFQDEIQKALSAKRTIIGNNLGLNNDLEKGGKNANIGEVRTHGGKQMVKTATGWEPYKQGHQEQAHEPLSHDGSKSANPDKKLGQTSTGKDIYAHATKHVNYSSKEYGEAKATLDNHLKEHGHKLSDHDKEYLATQSNHLRQFKEDREYTEDYLAKKEAAKKAGKGKFSEDGNNVVNAASGYLHPYLKKLGVKIDSNDDEGVHELTDKNGKKHTITQEDDPHVAMRKYSKIAKLHGGKITHRQDDDGDEYHVKFGS